MNDGGDVSIIKKKMESNNRRSLHLNHYFIILIFIIFLLCAQVFQYSAQDLCFLNFFLLFTLTVRELPLLNRVQIVQLIPDFFPISQTQLLTI